MEPLLRLSLRQLASRSRLLLILLLAALPVALTALISNVEGKFSNSEFINHILDGLLIAGILPIVTMVLATSAFGNEMEDRTLSYLVLKPVRRWLIVLPKLLASIIVGGLVLIASGVIATRLGASSIVGATVLVLDGSLQAALAVGVALFAGVVTYTAIFTWAGLVSTRAIAFALIYVFLWEGLISTFFGGVRYLSVRGYTLAILHGMDDETFAPLKDRVIEFPAALVGAAVITTVFFWLTVRHLRRMDVP
ncbi:MAG: transporter permease subunit [Dehalococcoidia bacterium]|nr:transporter permease subunit [Dehalococcoidia bacterium]